MYNCYKQKGQVTQDHSTSWQADQRQRSSVQRKNWTVNSNVQILWPVTERRASQNGSSLKHGILLFHHNSQALRKPRECTAGSVFCFNLVTFPKITRTFQYLRLNAVTCSFTGELLSHGILFRPFSPDFIVPGSVVLEHSGDFWYKRIIWVGVCQQWWYGQENWKEKEEKDQNNLQIVCQF